MPYYFFGSLTPLCEKFVRIKVGWGLEVGVLEVD